MAYEEDVVNGDKDLLALLQVADAADVGSLVDFLTDSGDGRLAMATDVRKALVGSKQKNKYSRDTLLLVIRELQLFGGNSIANLIRRTGVPYAEIVRDVLKYVGGSVTGNESVEALELKVLEKLVTKVWEKMSAQERADFARKFHDTNGAIDIGLSAILAAIRDGGLGAAKAGFVGVSGIGALLAEGAFSVGVTTAAGRVATGLLGPVGMALAGAAGVHLAAKEAYRVTLQCVAQIAYIRQKHAGASAG